MTYLGAAVLGAVCVVNLCLLLTLVRRVRRQDERLAVQARLRPLPALKAGNTAPEFTVSTVAGETRSLADLKTAGGLVAFLTPDCAECLARVPDLKEYARTHPGGGASVIAVVCGVPDKGAPLAGELRDSMSVVLEPAGGPVQRAYAVSEHPLFYVIRADGRIAARGSTIEPLDHAPLGEAPLGEAPRALAG
ncbi:MAG: peroxiredoxin family protein [Trebonia sp.]